MGCSSSSQTQDVVPPSSQYFSSGTKPAIEALPEPKSPEPIEKHDVQVPEPQPKKEEDRVMTAATQELKHEAMKHVPEGKAFIFGQSQNQRKIVLLDCQKMQFSILSNRTQTPNTPHKYQPQEVIFQQSQELLASNLFNTNSHPPYNFMFTTFTSDQTIFLCGGVNYQFDYISEEAFLFRVASIANEEPQPRRKKGGNNLVGNKFQKLPCMRQKRYSHMGAYFNMGKLGYIYIFGGRDQDQGLLNTCERYSIEQKKWTEISPMKMSRSTGFSFIFKNKIYVFGGYTGEKKRSKTIEVFDPFKNYWECLNVKLHRGIEAGLIFSVKPNQVLLMGGNMESGSLKSVIRLNLAQQTYVWDSNMKNERLLQKGVKLKDMIYVFGGDFQDNFEKYNLKDKKWKDHQFSFNQFVSTDDINSYQMASETLEVAYDQSTGTKNDHNDYQKHLIFGNDNFPCILQLNLTKWVLKKKVVPMVLRLRCHMGVTKVVEGKYFVCGGIDSFEQKPSRASYIYYAGTNKAIEVGKMKSKKYNFAICSNSKFVYVFGGKNQSGEIIKQCEKYSFEEEKWVSLPDLPSERQGSKAVMISHNKILLLGGSDTLQTVTSIDIFDMQSETFWNPKQSLPIPAQVRGVHLQETPSLCVYIFSYNQVLGKYYCHHLPLHIPDHNEEVPQAQKIQDNFSAIKEVEETQINVKIIPFIHAFSFENKMNLITPKGLFNWEPTLDSKTQTKFDNQIVINQVEMMQYPIDKFSTP